LIEDFESVNEALKIEIEIRMDLIVEGRIPVNMTGTANVIEAVIATLRDQETIMWAGEEAEVRIATVDTMDPHDAALFLLDKGVVVALNGKDIATMVVFMNTEIAGGGKETSTRIHRRMITGIHIVTSPHITRIITGTILIRLRLLNIITTTMIK
jgi:hypothetical protein